MNIFICETIEKLIVLVKLQDLHSFVNGETLAFALRSTATTPLLVASSPLFLVLSFTEAASAYVCSPLSSVNPLESTERYISRLYWIFFPLFLAFYLWFSLAYFVSKLEFWGRKLEKWLFGLFWNFNLYTLNLGGICLKIDSFLQVMINNITCLHSLV